MVNKILKISILIFFYVLIYFLLKLPSQTLTFIFNKSQTTLLKQVNNKTTNILSQLVKTKYFRLLRLNLNTECPLSYMNKLCKSKSCSVCRCDEKDIPQNWIITDKVQSTDKDKDIWAQERDETPDKWIWHVEDEQNDRGQYFDVHMNTQSFSGYNGSYIWSLIYEQNCFKGVNHLSQMCLQQKVLYKIISGLHTSISSHLSRLHKNITKVALWANQDDENYYFNHIQYNNRILQHPQRIKNLLFLYSFIIRSIKEMIPKLQNYIINSQNIVEDLLSTNLLNNLFQQLKKINLKPLHETQTFFFQVNNIHVKQYQKYIHNISRILNCVDCQKCRLFGKMQTYGLGTALKILLGYHTQYKRNQLVALFNTLNKISISVNTYFNYPYLWNQDHKTPLNKSINIDLQSDKYPPELNFLLIWLVCGSTILLFIWIVTNWNYKSKIKKQFDKAFSCSPNVKIQ